MKIGDWVCPDCGNTNYKKRVKCNICSQDKGSMILKITQVNQD